MATNTNYRVPDPLRYVLTAATWRTIGDVFANSIYENYEIASDIADKSQEKRAAVFLTCIGNDAYDAFRAIPWPNNVQTVR